MRMARRGICTDAPMNCQEVSEFLMDYLDSTLPLRQRLVFKLHLLLCRDCRRYLDSYETTVQLTHSLRAEPSSENMPPIPPELVQAILAARGSQSTELPGE